MAADLESVQEKSATSEDGNHDQPPGQPNQKATEQGLNKDVVDWEGPKDPQNPQNWPAWKRMIQVVFASAFLLTA